MLLTFQIYYTLSSESHAFAVVAMISQTTQLMFTLINTCALITKIVISFTTVVLFSFVHFTAMSNQFIRQAAYQFRVIFMILNVTKA